MKYTAKENKHLICFDRLVEERAMVIKKIYSLMSKVMKYTESYIDPKETEMDNKDYVKTEKVKISYQSIKELCNYFDENRIYFSNNICGKMDVFIDKINRLAVHINIDVNKVSFQKRIIWFQSWESIKNEVPNLKKRFRGRISKYHWSREELRLFILEETINPEQVIGPIRGLTYLTKKGGFKCNIRGGGYTGGKSHHIGGQRMSRIREHRPFLKIL